MTTLVITVPSPDGARTFEFLVHLQDQIALAETCIEVYPDSRREWRDTRSTVLAVGRLRGGAT